MAGKGRLVLESGLTEFEESFINEYVKNGGNGRHAFLKFKPSYSPVNASSTASKILKKPEAQTFLELRMSDAYDKEKVDKSFLVQNLKKIVNESLAEEIERDEKGKITNKPDRTNALKALDQLAKLGGYYGDKPNLTVQSTGEIKILMGDGWNPNDPIIEDTLDSYEPIALEESIDYEEIEQEVEKTDKQKKLDLIKKFSRERFDTE